MSESALGSSAALAMAALFALLLVRSLRRRVLSASAAWVLVALFVIAAAAGIYFVDANIPLAQSHFRPSGGPAPLWAALLALGSRFAALFALIYLAPWMKSRRTLA